MGDARVHPGMEGPPPRFGTWTEWKDVAETCRFLTGQYPGLPSNFTLVPVFWRVQSWRDYPTRSPMIFLVSGFMTIIFMYVITVQHPGTGWITLFSHCTATFIILYLFLYFIICFYFFCFNSFVLCCFYSVTSHLLHYVKHIECMLFKCAIQINPPCFV